ncbi:MAG: beta-galactosidase [Planctomycetota bacterium]|nr:beta-galactosidase [Planctomycetota bacterium]
MNKAMRRKPALLLAALLMCASARAEHLWIEGEKPTTHNFKKHNWYDSVAKDRLSGGDWLSNYGPNPAEAGYAFQAQEGGEYTLWVRCNNLMVAQHYKLDAGEWIDCELRKDPREEFTISPKPDHRNMAWHLVAKLQLPKGEHTLAFRLSSKLQNHGGIDCFVLSNRPFTPSGTSKPGDAAAEGKPDEWFAFLPAQDPFNPDSLIDMRRLWHAPAGKFGPVTREGSNLVIDGKPVKFWGCGANVKEDKPREWQAQWALYLAKYGVNAVRQHSVEEALGPLQKNAQGERVFDAKKLDAYDWWFAELKKNGIYTCWSPFYPHLVSPDDGYDLFDDLPEGRHGLRNSSGVVNVEEKLQDAEWVYLKTLLEHKNPYTGMRYVDDPALAVVEVHNEDCIFWHSPLNTMEGNKGFTKIAARLKARWADWLKARYGSDEKLKAAWGAGLRQGDSVENKSMGIYGAWEMAAEGPKRNGAEKARMGDFIRFLAELQRGYYERRAKRLRELGFKGVTMSTAWKAGGPAADPANLWCDDAMDMIDRHNYFGGGKGGHGIAPGEVHNGTHLSQPGGALLAIGRYQVEDKPFCVTEWTSLPPNQWKAEAAPLFAFYGMALQGWDASYHFLSARQHLTGGWPNLSSYVTDTPHYAGQFPALAFALHKQHLKEAPIAAARRLAPDQLFQGVDALSQDLTGGYDQKEAKGNLDTPTEILAVGRVSVAFGKDLKSEKSDWAKCWDKDAKTIRSMTGELRWDYGKRFVAIESPKTQGLLGFAGGQSHALPAVTVDLKTEFVSLIFTPLDDKPLAESAQILITALARDKQTGAEYNADGTQLAQTGSPPLLLEPVQAAIALKGAPPKEVNVVDMYGDRTGKQVPVEAGKFAIDGRYKTYYYEVKR